VPSRAESDSFREQVLFRVVEEATQLASGVPLPRTRASFDQLVAASTPRLEPAFTVVTRAIALASSELEATLRATEAASKQPSGVAVGADVRLQLEQLFPTDLLLDVDLSWLQHFPRYLRAARTRLDRAVADPRKDASKLAPFAPLWRAFLAKRALVRDSSAARVLHWKFEELRVAIFAPELKPAIPVSISSLSLALDSLS